MTSDSYHTLAGPAEAIYKEKSSKFLAYAYPVESEEEIRTLLDALRKKYYDATHHCYAWRLGPHGETFRANDDGEPSGTAGKPILGQLLSNELVNCLIVVVRYFGGTKLGVSGLIGAYKESAAEAIRAAEIVERTVDTVVEVEFSYLAMNDVMRVVKEEQPRVLTQQFDNLCRHSIILTIEAQRLHKEMVPRPFLSSCIEHCMESGKDLSQGGAKYNVGPVITGIGLAVVANSLAAVKKLVFEDQVCDMQTLAKAFQANWEGFDDLREQAKACPKYGNDDRYVDDIAIEIANHFYHEIHQYRDIFGSPFNTAFMGISNYIPMGRVLGATPCGRKNGEPSSEGVSPFVGTDTSTPLAAMRSAAKLNQEIHSGGTLLNLRLDHNLVATKRGQANLGAMVQTLFSLGAFHVQFNCISSEVLRDAQAHPENYKDLLVRVAGYSTQFVNLSKSMQDAIIARTEHSNF